MGIRYYFNGAHLTTYADRFQVEHIIRENRSEFPWKLVDEDTNQVIAEHTPPPKPKRPRPVCFQQAWTEKLRETSNWRKTARYY